MTKLVINGSKLGQTIIWFVLFMCMMFSNIDIFDIWSALFAVGIIFIFAYMFQKCLGEAIYYAR